LTPGGGKVRTDLTGLAGDDRNSGGFQNRPGVETDTASNELADAVPGERFGRPDPGTAYRGGAGVGHHKDVTAVGIDYQKIKASAESRLYAVFNVIPICGESDFQNAPLTAGPVCDDEGSHA
jgi:hypothetical protein